MNERDGLAADISSATDHWTLPILGEDASKIAVELEEKGYRKPRTITTAEAITLLDPGTVIQGPDFHEETYKCTAPGTFHAIASPTEYRPSELIGRGPFAILWEPQP